jgi:hypothetical protein
MVKEQGSRKLSNELVKALFVAANAPLAAHQFRPATSVVGTALFSEITALISCYSHTAHA